MIAHQFDRAYPFLNRLYQSTPGYFIIPSHPPTRPFWMGIFCHYAGLAECSAYWFALAQEHLAHYDLWRKRVAYVLGDESRGKVNAPPFIWPIAPILQQSSMLHNKKV